MLTILRGLWVAVAFISLSCASTLASDTPWKAVSPGELALKESSVEKDADAQILFKEVFVEFGSSRITTSNYVRIKIFTQRGVEEHSKIELSYLDKDKIEQIAGRTIKADGSIVDLKPDAIFDREIVRLRRLKLKSRSFVMPAVEPGAIIEYRWRESEKSEEFSSLRLDLQDSIPAGEIVYKLKIPAEMGLYFRSKTFNGPEVNFIPIDKGQRTATVNAVPSYRDEPLMPPKNQVRSWILIYFSDAGFALRYSEAMVKSLEPIAKPSDEVRKAATSIVGTASTPDQKLELIFEFCKSKIRNINQPDPGVLISSINFKENKSPADTLKQGIGTGSDINFLFAALASAAGLSPFLAQVPDRSDIFFDPTKYDIALSLHFLSASHIAVQVNNEWRFFDPASRYVTYGMLRWQEEGEKALVFSNRMQLSATTPISGADKSQLKRSAKLRLTEDGTLEGDIRVETTGHHATEERLTYSSGSPAEYETSFKEDLKERLPAAGVSDIRVENPLDSSKPFVYAYKINVPAYAERTGRRLFLKPSYFQYGRKPLFTAAERRNPVYFSFPWSEDDTVLIELPSGYTLESPDAPAPVVVGKMSEYKVKMAVLNGRTLEYRRSFYFGGGGVILFPRESYSQLKSVFDSLDRNDNHIVTLKQSDQQPVRKSP